MAAVAVRWRPSGGRGEWEIVPSGALVDKEVVLRLPELGITVPAEVTARNLSGKPRLRKRTPNDRNKLHLVPLVMAIARLPDPAREDHGHPPRWPLQNKRFLIREMVFAVEQIRESTAYLRPLRAAILNNSDTVFDLTARLKHVATDYAIADKASPELADAIRAHWDALQAQVNSSALRDTADEIQALLDTTYGESNAASLSTIVSIAGATEDDSYSAPEGRLLRRVHHRRERNPKLAKAAKKAFRVTHGGRLYCECCGFEPASFYGERGAERVQAHHLVPVSELVDDSVTRVEDFAMVCPNCHDLIHAKRPWLTLDQVREAIRSAKSTLTGL